MYPGIGPKTAERLAFFTIQKCSKEDVENFSNSLKEAKEKTKKCAVCGCFTDRDVCEIFISSFDSDFFQLIDENVKVLRYRGDNSIVCDKEFLSDIKSFLCMIKA